MDIVKASLDTNKTVDELGLKNNDIVEFDFTTDVHAKDVIVIDTNAIAVPSEPSAANSLAASVEKPNNPFACNS